MIEAMCPISGEQMTMTRTMSGLTKEMIVDYGDNWLDENLADVAAGWLVRIKQWVEMTSEQAPQIVDYVDRDVPTRWLPRAAAERAAKAQLRRFSRLKRWGGGR